MRLGRQQETNHLERCEWAGVGLVELHGQPSWVAVLTPFWVDGMIVAALTALLADSRSGGRASSCRGRCWWPGAWRAWRRTSRLRSRRRRAG